MNIDFCINLSDFKFQENAHIILISFIWYERQKYDLC